MPRTADGVAPTTWCSKSFCPGFRRVQIGPMDANEWHERHFGDVRRYSARAAAEDASMSSFVDVLLGSAFAQAARQRRGPRPGRGPSRGMQQARPSPAERAPGFRAFSRARQLWVDTGATPPSARTPVSAFAAPPYHHAGAFEEREHVLQRDYVAWLRAQEEAAMRRAQHGVNEQQQQKREGQRGRWRRFQENNELFVETGATPPSTGPSLLPERLHRRDARAPLAVVGPSDGAGMRKMAAGREAWARTYEAQLGAHIRHEKDGTPATISSAESHSGRLPWRVTEVPPLSGRYPGRPDAGDRLIVPDAAPRDVQGRLEAAPGKDQEGAVGGGMEQEGIVLAGFSGPVQVEWRTGHGAEVKGSQRAVRMYSSDPSSGGVLEAEGKDAEVDIDTLQGPEVGIDPAEVRSTCAASEAEADTLSPLQAQEGSRHVPGRGRVMPQTGQGQVGLGVREADGVEFEGEDEGACAPTTEGAAGGGHAVPWEDEGYAGVPATAVWGAAEERTAALQSVLAVLGS